MKIAIFYNHPSNYTGGFNYIVNIIKILTTRHHIYLYCPSVEKENFKKIFHKNTNLKIKELSFLNKRSFIYIISKLMEKVFNSFYFYDRILINNKIDLTIFSYYFGKYKFVHWFPDFQFFHFPQNFTEDKKKLMSKTKLIYEKSLKVILSSNDSKKDLAKILKLKEKEIIFNFPVNLVLNEKSNQEAKKVLSRYKIKNQMYLIICNQFWEHKNHENLFKFFLKYKKKSNFDLKLLCTGDLRDNRKKNDTDFDFYQKSGDIIILGKINDYSVVQSLIFYSLAYLNPSFFEGWNTGVEEAKALKKPILASNIGVHKEQLVNYDKKFLFNPYNFKNLSKNIDTILLLKKTYSTLKEIKKSNRKNVDLKSYRFLDEIEKCQ